jgi:hypothetical protein
MFKIVLFIVFEDLSCVAMLQCCNCVVSIAPLPTGPNRVFSSLASSASPPPRFRRSRSALPTGHPWVFNLTDATLPLFLVSTHLASSAFQQTGCHFSPAHQLAGLLSRVDARDLRWHIAASIFQPTGCHFSPARQPAQAGPRVDMCRVGMTHLASSGRRLGPLRRHFPPAQCLPVDSLVPT